VKLVKDELMEYLYTDPSTILPRLEHLELAMWENFLSADELMSMVNSRCLHWVAAPLFAGVSLS
jgi:hypothetical protein